VAWRHGQVATDGAISVSEPRWRHRHLLDVAGLERPELEMVMDRAAAPPEAARLRGRRVAILFYEASTRTRISFEVAARTLGAEVIDISAATSSVAKGESLVDTVRTLDALGCHMLVVRHPRSGAAHLAAGHFTGHVVNAGDGWHAHPTQALLDLYTLRRRLVGGRVEGAKIVIVGDVLHSRVARSNIWTLTTSGADLWLCGPAALLRGFDAWARAVPADRRLTVTSDLAAALRDADAVMALRIQRERMEAWAYGATAGYAARYGIVEDRLRLARPGCIVLHPGPVNEGVELGPEVSGGPRSAIADQVANGVAVRTAVLALLAGVDGAHD
jgi:aspartate carbamoyltransferase catalytic subunit